jgi:hypothetical protein
MKWIGLGLLGVNALGLHILAINPFSLNVFLGVLTCEIWLAAWTVAFASEMRLWAYRRGVGGSVGRTLTKGSARLARNGRS